MLGSLVGTDPHSRPTFFSRVVLETHVTADDRDLDTGRLDSYLSEALGVTVVETDVLQDGLNLSLAISTAETENAYVLRQPRKLRETAFFNDLRDEYRLLEHLSTTTVPVPEPVHYCADATVFGGEFFLMSYLDGEEIPVGSELPDRFQTPTAREALAFGFIDTLADIHTLDTEQFEDCCTHETHEDQIADALGRIDQVERVTRRERPVLREVGDWLLDNVPTDTRTALLHGDYKLGNVFVGGDDEPRITGVVDWETASLGDPLAELGYALTYWRDSTDSPPTVEDLRGTYSEDALRDVRRASQKGLYPFTTAPGSPSRRDLVDRYEDQTGFSVDSERFYRAREAFLLATVWADLHRTDVAAGEDTGGAPLVEYMARVARRIADGDL